MEENNKENFTVELLITGTISHQEHHCTVTTTPCDLGFSVRVNQFHSLYHYLENPFIFEEAVEREYNLRKKYNTFVDDKYLESLAKYSNKGLEIIKNIEYIRLFPDNLNVKETIKEYPLIQQSKIVLPIFKEKYDLESLENIINEYNEYINNIYVMTYDDDSEMTYVKVLDLYEKEKQNNGPVKTLGTIDKNRK